MNTNSTVEIYSLSRPELLGISDSESSCFGGNQDWFPEKFKQKKGCGIVAAGNIFMYMAGTAPEYTPLYRGERTRADFTSHIGEISRYLKAGIFGIWGAKRFTSGALAFAKARGIALAPRKLTAGFTAKAAAEFIKEGLEKDKPIAMLIGFNKRLKSVSCSFPGGSRCCSLNAHWVTVTELRTEENTGKFTVRLSTWGASAEIDLEDYVRGERFCRKLILFE
ncbi:MAG: hypothetical protein ACI4J4_01450 [Ruminiclostridium sp.]